MKKKFSELVVIFALLVSFVFIGTISCFAYSGMVKPVDVKDYDPDAVYNPKTRHYLGVPGTGTYDYSTMHRDNEDGGAISGCNGEGCGSHPGVDIPIPSGTEVVAIADGVVFRSEDIVDKNGITKEWGGLVVIKHDNIPDVSEPIWSIYAHLKVRYVNKDETVKKGQVIGLSGGDKNDPHHGNSTAAHLHFQIDRDTRADTGKGFTSPYWPSDVNKADVNNMVDNYCYNPILFIQTYQSPLSFTFDSASPQGFTCGYDTQEAREPQYGEWRIHVVNNPPTTNPGIVSPKYASGMMAKGTVIKFSAKVIGNDVPVNAKLYIKHTDGNWNNVVPIGTIETDHAYHTYTVDLSEATGSIPIDKLEIAQFSLELSDGENGNDEYWYLDWLKIYPKNGEVYSSVAVDYNSFVGNNGSVLVAYNDNFGIGGDDQVAPPQNQPPRPSGASSPYTFTRSTFCAGIDADNSYSPIGEKETFVEDDDFMLWFKLEKMNIPVQAKAAFWMPDGGLYETDIWDEVNVSDGSDYIFWSSSKHVSGYGGCYPDTMKWQGEWTVKIYINDELVNTNHFNIKYNQVATIVYYKDYDGDGYSDGTTQLACSQPHRYKLASYLISTSSDCDDDNQYIHPDARETCADGIDQNCDGRDQQCFPDSVIDSPGTDIFVKIGDPVYFSGTATDRDNQFPLTYLWDFGGGAPNSTVEDPGNVWFFDLGTYIATFTVTDSAGLSDPTPSAKKIMVIPPYSVFVPDNYPTIQSAIEAVTGGAMIIVRDGNYYESVNFLGKSITVMSANGPSVTRIQCPRGATAAVMFDNSAGNSSPKISGFFITAYYNNAIFCRKSSPTIENCILGQLSRNGAIYGTLSTITVKNCTISDSKDSNYGGGICVKSSTLTVKNSTISGNKATNGGGVYGEVSTITVSDSEISGNKADNCGGGIFARYSTIALTNCIVSGNQVTIDGAMGGGIYCDEGSRYTATFTNCLIVKNTAPYYSRYNFSVFGKGGGVYLRDFSKSTFTNCTIAGNNAAKGGGVYYHASLTTMSNCVFSNNFACGDGGAIYCYASSTTQVTNGVLWGNGPNKIGIGNSSLAISYSDVEGGYAGTGNINQDPLFVDMASGNYHLQSTSPCIGAGQGGKNMGIE